MKPFFLFVALVTAGVAAEPSNRRANLVVLDEAGVKNLRIETAVAEPGDFEETAFALGTIEAKAGSASAVSSRISGRVVSISVVPGDTVNADAEVVRVESRQLGGPVVGLRAPTAGTVMRVDVRPGDPVEPDRALIEMVDLRAVFAVARVPESIAARIGPGTTAHITVPALGAEPLEGTLLRFGTEADPVSGTLSAVFVLSNEQGRLRPGLRAEFSIVVSKRTGVVSVPRSALQGDPAGRFVYVKDFDLPHAFLRTPVVTGQSNGRAVEIVQGLLPADEVVTQGAYSLAFAGAGTIGLKEALDAAHGHAHNADGSEIASGASAHSHADHTDHEDHGSEAAHSPFWMIVSGVLSVLLVVVVVGRRRRDVSAASEPTRASKPGA